MVPPPLLAISLPMTIPIVMSGKMRRRRLTLGHRNLRNPRCGFELINVSVRWWVVNRDEGGRRRHCEELLRRSNPVRGTILDCFVALLLAMTVCAAKNAQKRNTAVDNVMTPL
jgi:hypothetical protein